MFFLGHRSAFPFAGEDFMQQIEQSINDGNEKEDNAPENIYQMVREHKILATIRPWQKVVKRKRFALLFRFNQLGGQGALVNRHILGRIGDDGIRDEVEK